MSEDNSQPNITGFQYCYIVLAIILLSAIALIYWLFYKFITIILPTSLGLIVLFFAFYLLFYYICRFIVFPGSFTLWRRSMENNFGKDMARRNVRRYRKLKYLVEFLYKKKQSKDQSSTSSSNINQQQDEDEEIQQQHQQQQQGQDDEEEKDRSMVIQTNPSSNITDYSINNFNDLDLDYDDLLQIRNTIYTIFTSYTELKKGYTLSKYQKQFSIYIERLIELLEKCELKNLNLHNNNFGNVIRNNNLKDLLFYQQDILYDILISQIKEVSINKKIGEQISQTLEDIIYCLEDLLTEKKFKERMKQWLFNDTLGSVDQLRVELINHFGSQRFFLNGFDGCQIDCMFIPAPEELKPKNKLQDLNCQEGDSNYRFIQNGDTTGPTILFCNPNAGFYEFLYYDSEWVEFYMKQGINIVIWNYRGYGRSQGTPSPRALAKDSELLVDHLRSHFKVKTLGIHGQSLGGMTATYLARKKKVDFLLADRTFGVLSDVAIYGLGRTFKILFKLIVNWDLQSGHNFHNSDCFKVIAYDPRDQVIPYMASLKNNVSRYRYEYLFNNNSNSGGQDTEEQEDYEFNYQNKSSSNNIWQKAKQCHNSMFGSFRHNCHLTWSLDTRMHECANLLLSDVEMVEMFYALQRLMDIIKEIANWKEKLKIEQYKSLYRGTPPSKLKQSLNSDIYGQGNLQEFSRSNSGFSSTSAGSEYMQNEDKIDLSPQMNSLNDTKENIIPNTSDRLGSDGENSYKDCLKKQQAKDILQMCNDDLKSSEDFQDFILNIFQLFDYIDAAGLSMSDIFTLYKSNRELIFEQFLTNIQVYGSNYPWRFIKDNLGDHKQYKRIFQQKLRNYLQHSYNLIKEQKMNQNVNNNNSQDTQNKTINKKDTVKELILQDLETVHRCIGIIYNKLQNNQYSQQQQQQIQQQQQVQKQKQANKMKEIEMTEIQNKLNQDEKIEIPINNSNNNINNIQKQNGGIGGMDAHVIVLNCGHNGIYSRKEIYIYEQYLKASGFIPDYDGIRTNINNIRRGIN